MLDRLRGGLIVSIQPEHESPLNTPAIVAALARCAAANGAAGVRIEGLQRIAAVRAAVTLPIVGIIKRADPGFEPYITTTIADVVAVLEAGAAIVAFDATGRARRGGATLEQMIEAIHARGGLAMADCARLADGRAASEAGADLIATTLSGYTPETEGETPPALDLVMRFAKLHALPICEGGIADPRDVERAFAAGAQAVVVGTALTNIDARIRRFAQAAPRPHSC
jgi:N-acylglucosamine-6-phosphate 2-epimerase